MDGSVREIPAPFPYEYAEGFAIDYNGGLWIWDADNTTWKNITGGGPGAYEPIIPFGTAAQYWTGQKLWADLITTVVPEGTNKYYTTARALADVTWTTITGKPATFAPDPEAVDDRVAALLTAGTNITLSYDDTANRLTINSTGAGGGGTVTAVTGTAPVVSSGGNTPAISMPPATTSVSGHLTAADWNTFNGKQAFIVAGSAVQYYRGDKTWANLDKAAVGLGNVDNTSDANKPVSTATQTALNLKEDKSNKGVANGYASLDASAKVPASQLPAYVDDVLEFANLAAFPATGTVGVIYIALDTNKVYRWSGSAYTEISPSPGSTDAVPEGSTNLYYKSSRALADVTWTTITGKPATFPPSAHTHPISEVTNLQTTLDGKVNKAGDTMTGALTLIPSVTGGNQATTKNYVDNAIATREPIILAGDPAMFWAGDKTWKPLPASGGISVSDTPPASPSSGNLWWESDSGALFVYYIDPNTSQWVQVNAAGMPEAPVDGESYARKDGAWYNLDNKYLPLTGGTVSGGVTFDAYVYFNKRLNVNSEISGGYAAQANSNYAGLGGVCAFGGNSSTYTIAGYGGYGCYVNGSQNYFSQLTCTSCIFNVATTTSGATGYLSSGGGLYRSTSQGMFKQEVEDLEPEYADKVLSLRTIFYRPNELTVDPTDWSRFGFLTEDAYEKDFRFTSCSPAPKIDENGNQIPIMMEIMLPDENGELAPSTVPSGEYEMSGHSPPSDVDLKAIVACLLDVVRRQGERIAALEAASGV